MELIRSSNYTLLDHFILSQDIWWKDYYSPLKKLIKDAKAESPFLDGNIIKEIKTIEREIEQFSFDDDRFGSVFFVLRKQ